MTTADNPSADKDVAGNLPCEDAGSSSLEEVGVMDNMEQLTIEPGLSAPSPLLGRGTAYQNFQSLPSFLFPPYIMSIEDRLNQETLNYLERKGALTLPPENLRNEFLRCYAEFIHPLSPILDLNDIINTIDGNYEGRAISLLLFQAIMFAGSAGADIRLLKAAGYETHRHARAELFLKVRLLFDCDAEADSLAVIQSVLLMTYWFGSPSDGKDCYHWMGIAISISQREGLHRDPYKSKSMNQSTKRLRKRLWWSIYMRDKIIALFMRRPTIAKDDDFDVSMLEMDDFNCLNFSTGLSRIPTWCKLVCSAEKQCTAAILCIEMTKLCTILSKVLSVQYLFSEGIFPNANGCPNDTRNAERIADATLSQVNICNELLRAWRASLPACAVFCTELRQNKRPKDQSVIINTSLLHLMYFATLSALHRQLVFHAKRRVHGFPLSTQGVESRNIATWASRKIAIIVTSLYNSDLVQYLPGTSVVILLPAMVTHLLDMALRDETARKDSRQYFYQCVLAMLRLRSIYVAADFSISFINSFFREIARKGPE
ncbi:hypothetical protein NQ176_g1617 [Zarea fungicola]|uniref:Uncharacterized protein n=1 Tax=Zarea fungicola TaxID=93591 RepID=A0ACC1NSK8_9HYPO|nr:hypothetical protein NQ176_g1617 [Lecanicillium fungicola]